MVKIPNPPPKRTRGGGTSVVKHLPSNHEFKSQCCQKRNHKENEDKRDGKISEKKTREMEGEPRIFCIIKKKQLRKPEFQENKISPQHKTLHEYESLFLV
jgi:hypothetical protein